MVAEVVNRLKSEYDASVLARAGAGALDGPNTSGPW
jgi:hypothetical protein